MIAALRLQRDDIPRLPRQIAAMGGDVSGFVPGPVAAALVNRFARG